MYTSDSPNVKLANDYLGGSAASPQELLRLAKELKKENAFQYARKLLDRAAHHKDINTLGKNDKITLHRELALCISKDRDLPAHSRHDDALKVIQTLNDYSLDLAQRQDTLGIAGGVLKRKWEATGQEHHLERSLACYLGGYEIGINKPIETDKGYTGVNAAYVLDLLASLEDAQAKQAGTILADAVGTSETAARRRERARSIRNDLVQRLTVYYQSSQPAGTKTDLDRDWWFLTTMAELHLGLQEYDKARGWLDRASILWKDKKVEKWEFETTTKQLASLARLQHISSGETIPLKETEGWKLLRHFLDQNDDAVRTAFLGKVGLALSGGGFRASLYHIGVLAKLAELDMLRHVEVLSCVSGGSIIGAHYYLAIREKLQQEHKLNRDAYVKIIANLMEDFLAGVQRNIRTRVGSNLWANLKMFLPNYSRTDRLAQLFEKELFARVFVRYGARPTWVMKELFVAPQGSPVDFIPRYDNWLRADKIPTLILNATSLNTGHNWQFTASWMGEPPGLIENEIDKSYRLRRPYFWQAPRDYQSFHIGQAVAASACVPGLFDPVSLTRLYKDITVRLVDGGVYDNQGVESLHEQDCNVLLVSDASGQMNTDNRPSAGILAIPLRSTSILQGRVRGAEYQDLRTRRQASQLRGLMFVHMTKGLDIEEINWITGSQSTKGATDSNSDGALTEYGIHKETQKLLAGIRTDLDSFSDTEAFALMTSGYRMTEKACAELAKAIPELVQHTDSAKWRFLEVEEQMKNIKDHPDFEKQLVVASQTAWKVWELSRPLNWALRIARNRFIRILTLGVLIYLAWGNMPSLGTFIAAAGVFMAGAYFVFVLGRSFCDREFTIEEAMSKFITAIGLISVGWIIAWAHLKIFDPWYLRLGSVKGTSLDER
jgi:predicted acylesterase/phospholipase RssA